LNDEDFEPASIHLQFGIMRAYIGGRDAIDLATESRIKDLFVGV
jgi:hypothetical protein